MLFNYIITVVFWHSLQILQGELINVPNETGSDQTRRTLQNQTNLAGVRSIQQDSLLPDWMFPTEILDSATVIVLPKKPKKKKLQVCNSLNAPCLCTDSVCCGSLSGNIQLNCAWVMFDRVSNGVSVIVNPCSDSVCVSGTCKVIALISKTGDILSRRGECCSAGQFSQVNCGNGIECQQDNKNGTYTVCCSPSCSQFGKVN